MHLFFKIDIMYQCRRPASQIVVCITTVIAILVPTLALFPFDVVIYFIRRLMRPEGHGIVVLSFWNVICRRHHSTSLIDGPLSLAQG